MTVSRPTTLRVKNPEIQRYQELNFTPYSYRSKQADSSTTLKHGDLEIKLIDGKYVFVSVGGAKLSNIKNIEYQNGQIISGISDEAGTSSTIAISQRANTLLKELIDELRGTIEGFNEEFTTNTLTVQGTLNGFNMPTPTQFPNTQPSIPHLVGVKVDGVMEVGKYIDFRDNGSVADYDFRFTCTPGKLSCSGTLSTNEIEYYGMPLYDWMNEMLYYPYITSPTIGGQATFNNNILLNNTTTASGITQEIRFEQGSDAARIARGGLNEQTYLEIATADDSNEPIYVRQYQYQAPNRFGTLTRTLTLLDNQGKTTIPVELITPKITLNGNDLQSTLNGKASSIHEHIISDITNLSSELNGKANSIHNHSISDVTYLDATLTGINDAIYDLAQHKASLIHSHVISDVTGLNDELNGKAPTVHNHSISDVTDLQTTLDNKLNTTKIVSTYSSGTSPSDIDQSSLNPGSIHFFTNDLANYYTTVLFQNQEAARSFAIRAKKFYEPFFYFGFPGKSQNENTFSASGGSWNKVLVLDRDTDLMTHSGNILLNLNSTSATVAGNPPTNAQSITWNMAGNDHGRIMCGQTGNDAGYMEISTADGGNEPIHVRQYSNNQFTTIARTLTLLDSSGNTTIPGVLNVTSTSPDTLNVLSAGIKQINVGQSLTNRLVMRGDTNERYIFYYDGNFRAGLKFETAQVNATHNINAPSFSISGTNLIDLIRPIGSRMEFANNPDAIYPGTTWVIDGYFGALSYTYVTVGSILIYLTLYGSGSLYMQAKLFVIGVTNSQPEINLYDAFGVKFVKQGFNASNELIVGSSNQAIHSNSNARIVDISGIILHPYARQNDAVTTIKLDVNYGSTTKFNTVYDIIVFNDKRRLPYATTAESYGWLPVWKRTS